MDPLERWFRKNLDDDASPEELKRQAEEAKQEQIDVFCRLATIKEEKEKQ